MITDSIGQSRAKQPRVLSLGLRGVTGDAPRRVHLRSEREVRLSRPTADLLALAGVAQSLLQALKVAHKPCPLSPHSTVHAVVDVVCPDAGHGENLTHRWNLSQPAVPRVLDHEVPALLDQGPNSLNHLCREFVALLNELDVSRPL